MAAHQRAFQRLSRELADTTNPGRRDELLDQWLDARDLATEWDADRWGFDPDRWCEADRAEMERRAADEEPAS